MKKVLIMLFAAMLPSIDAYSSFVTIEFSLESMTYRDYVINDYIDKPDALLDTASLSFDVDKIYSIVDNGDPIYTGVYFDIDLLDTNYIQSPLSKYFSTMGLDYYSDYYYDNFYGSIPFGGTLSETVDWSYEFGEFVTAYIGAGGWNQNDGLYHIITTQLRGYITTGPRNGDGTSDYALTGSNLVDYFEYFKSNDIPFTIEDYYYIGSQAGYVEGIYSSGLAYIRSISYQDSAVVTPEPNTALLLGIGIIGLLGIGRRRVS